MTSNLTQYEFCRQAFAAYRVLFFARAREEPRGCTLIKTHSFPPSLWQRLSAGILAALSRLKSWKRPRQPSAVSRTTLPIRHSQEQDNAAMQPVLKASIYLNIYIFRKSYGEEWEGELEISSQRNDLTSALSTAGYWKSHFPVNIFTLVKGEGKVETSPSQALTLVNKALRYFKPSTGWMCLLVFGRKASLPWFNSGSTCVSDKWFVGLLCCFSPRKKRFKQTDRPSGDSRDTFDLLVSDKLRWWRWWFEGSTARRLGELTQG